MLVVCDHVHFLEYGHPKGILTFVRCLLQWEVVVCFVVRHGWRGLQVEGLIWERDLQTSGGAGQAVA